MTENLYYDFQLTIQRLYIKIDFLCDIQVWWKKGKLKTSTKNPVRVTDRVEYIDFNQSLKVKVKCRFRDGKFEPKQTSIQVVMFPKNNENSCKNVGRVDIDLTQILDVTDLRTPTTVKFQRPLTDCPISNNRLLFSLSSTFSHDQNPNDSLNDISFQASNHNFFNRSSTDMTFRPPSIQANRRNSKYGEDQDRRPPLPNNENYDRRSAKTQNRVSQYRKSEEIIQRNEQPLGFSFGPFVGNPQKQKERKQMLDLINERNREISELKKEMERLQSLNSTIKRSQTQRGENSQRLLNLMNELNAANTTSQKLKKQKSQMGAQLMKVKDDLKEMFVNFNKIKQENRQLIANNNKIKDDNRQLLLNYNKAKEDSSLQRNQMANRYETRRKQFEQCKIKNQELKHELFKKQNELITMQKRFDDFQKQYHKKQIPLMEQMKMTIQQLSKQRTQIQKLLSDKSNALVKQQQQREYLQKSFQKLEDDFKAERSNLHKLYEEKSKENQKNLIQIETYMKKFADEKSRQFNQKQLQISQLKGRLQIQGKINEKLNKEIESQLIQISQNKIRIKNLEQICNHWEKEANDKQKDLSQKQKELKQKQQLIEKAKQYVKNLQIKMGEMQNAIMQRQQFIAKAKEHINNRERQFEAYIKKLREEQLPQKANTDEIENMKKHIEHLINVLQEKQKHLEECYDELESKHERIDELEGYVGTLQERLQINQEELEEVVRKNRSQQETLQQEVKKNLDMQIQLSLKNFELQSIKSYR